MKLLENKYTFGFDDTRLKCLIWSMKFVRNGMSAIYLPYRRMDGCNADGKACMMLNVVYRT